MSQRMAGQGQPPDEARADADHLRLKVKIYPIASRLAPR
jgi:hypothetical protein